MSDPDHGRSLGGSLAAGVLWLVAIAALTWELRWWAPDCARRFAAAGLALPDLTQVVLRMQQAVEARWLIAIPLALLPLAILIYARRALVSTILLALAMLALFVAGLIAIGLWLPLSRLPAASGG